jgi:formylglycine-generating enzyme required for sulfatase activity
MGNEGYLIQESRHPETKDIQTSCDPGWIPFGNRCVMKYEAKAMKKSDNSINLNGCNDAACLISTYTAVSVEEGKPWVKISQTNAKAACEAIGAHLITNAEWMAIARDIESVNSNWSDTVLNRGNSNTYASMNGTNPLLGFNKRTHTLSNGEIIWDIAGNVNEWVDETRLPSEIPSYREAWREFNSAEYTSKLPYNEVGPVNSTRTSSNGVGITYIDNNKSVYAFLRGGDWSYDTNAGVFTLTLTDSPSGSNMYVGFRCAR